MNTNRLIEDDGYDFNQKARNRAIEASRVAKLAKEAANKAQAAGNKEAAERLNAKADELEKAAASWNTATLQGHGGQQDSSGGAAKNKSAAKNSSADSKNGDPQGDNPQGADDKPESSEQNSGEESQGQGNEQGDSQNQKEGPGEDSKNKSANKQNENPGEKAGNAANRAQSAASGAKVAAQAAKEAAKDAQAKAEEAADNGDPSAEAKAEAAQKAQEAAQKAQEAAGEAEEAANEAEEAAKNNDTEGAKEAANKAEKAAKAAQKAASEAQKAASGQQGDDEDPDDESGEESENGSEKSKSSKRKGTKQGEGNGEDDGGEDEGEGQEDSGEQGDGDDDEDGDDDDDPVKDIFGMSNQPIMPNLGQQGQEPREPTVKEIIKMLRRLSGEAKRGAIDGLKDLINNKTESLKEDVFGGKDLRDLTDDEFADEINHILDDIDKIEKPVYIDPKEKKARIQKIETGLVNNPEAKREIENEENAILRQDFQKKKARERETEKYSKYKTIAEFKVNFYRSIKNQVERIEDDEDTYARINAPLEDDGLIRPGSRLDDIPGDVPIIDVFFDMSGSWYDDKMAIEYGRQIVATIKQFAYKGEIKLNVYYFSDEVCTDANDSRLDGGTGAWDDIQQTIISNRAKNVVLMTDRDMEGQAERGPVCRVDGEVWIIWRLANNTWSRMGGKSIPQKLIGKRGNHQYAFTTND